MVFGDKNLPSLLNCLPQVDVKLSFHTFQSSAAFENIQNAIKELDEKSTEVAAAIIKIALDNQLCRFSLFQQNLVMPFLTHTSVQ